MLLVIIPTLLPLKGILAILNITSYNTHAGAILLQAHTRLLFWHTYLPNQTTLHIEGIFLHTKYAPTSQVGNVHSRAVIAIISRVPSSTTLS